MPARKSTVRTVVVAVKDVVAAVGPTAKDPIGEALRLIKKPEPKVKTPTEKRKSPSAKTMSSGMKASKPTKPTAKTKGPALKGKTR